KVACHAYTEFRLRALDLERFAAAWHETIARHPMLRTVIQADATQRVLATVPELEIAFADLSQAPATQAEAAVQATRAAMARTVRPYDRWPLFEVRVTRVAPEDWRVHFGIDALILDGESTTLLLQEVFDRLHGRAVPQSPAQLGFRDYVLHLQGPAFAAAREQARAYWQARLDALPPAPALPLATDPSQLADPHFSRRHARLRLQAWQRLKARAAAAGLTPSAVLLAAYAEVLATWARSDDFTLNLTVGDRRPLAPEIARTLGVFTNLVPLAIHGARDASLRERALAQQRQLARDLDQRALSGVEVQRMLAQRAGDPQAGLLPVVFTSMLGEARAELCGERPEQHVEVLYSITETPQ